MLRYNEEESPGGFYGHRYIGVKGLLASRQDFLFFITRKYFLYEKINYTC